MATGNERLLRMQQMQAQEQQGPGAPTAEVKVSPRLLRMQQMQAQEVPPEQPQAPQEQGGFGRTLSNVLAYPGRAVEGIKKSWTGEERRTPETEGLPEVSFMGNLSDDPLANVKMGLAGYLTSGQARADIIEENLPGSRVDTDEKGNMILTRPDGKQGVLNAPGASPQDVLGVIGDIAAFWPATKLATLGKLGLAAKATAAGAGAAATEYGLQKGAQEIGSEQPVDLAKVAASGVLGVGAEVIGPAVRGMAAGRKAKKLGVEKESLAETAQAITEAKQITKETGIPLFRAQATGAPTDLERQAYVATLPGGSRKAATELKVQNAKAYQAVTDVLDRIAPAGAVETAPGRFQTVANQAIEAQKSIREEAASPLYKEAFKSKTPVSVNKTLTLIEDKLKDLPEKGDIARSLKKVRGLLGGKAGGKFKTAAEVQEAADRLSPKAVKILDNFGVIKNTPETKALPNLKGGERAAVTQGNSALKGGIPEKVTVWRKGTGEIEPGDFVSIEKSVASDLERTGGKLTSKEVPAGDVYLASDAQEFFFIPKGSKEKYPTLDRFIGEPTTAGSNIKKLHHAKTEIDQMVGRFGDKALGPTSKREVIEVKNALLEELDAVNPAYKAARAKFAEGSPAVTELQESIIGKVSKLDDTQLKSITSKLFDPSDVAATVKARKVIEGQDAQVWRDITRTHLSNLLGKMKSEIGESITSENVPGQIYRAIAGNVQKKKTLFAGLDAETSKNMEYLLDGLKRAGSGRPGGSQTAVRQILDKELKGGIGGTIRSFFTPLQTAASVGAEKSYNQRTKALANVLFDANWTELRKVNSGTQRAGAMLKGMLDRSLSEFGKPAAQTLNPEN